MNETIYPISSIVKYIKSSLEQNPYLNGILIQGEISNLKKHRSGHWYFTLKDTQARLSCVMFATYASRCHAKVEDGSKVIVKGSISMYEQQGSVQCYVTAIRNDGLGDLYLRYEELKKKLFQEGWFDESHKQSIPSYASNIGIISAKEGAALQDVLTTIYKRWPIARLTLYPAYVQGEQASASIIQALQKADQNNHDCLLLVRGGGSIEDLWGFNSEALVHCIYDLKTPIISGVGHESDTTLVDYVCDVRSPTPTGAAQRATADRNEVRKILQGQQQVLVSLIKRHLQENRQQLAFRSHSRHLQDPIGYVKDQHMHLVQIVTELEHYGETMGNNRRHLQQQRAMIFHLIKRHLLFQRQESTQHKKQLNDAIQLYWQQQQKRFQRSLSLLDAYSPLAVLKRGYTLVEQEGTYVKHADDLDIDKDLIIHFNDGSWRAQLKEKEETHGKERNI